MNILDLVEKKLYSRENLFINIKKISKNGILQSIKKRKKEGAKRVENSFRYRGEGKITIEYFGTLARFRMS